MVYDWCSLLWDAIPITSILIFHFKNFKPHSYELVIRVGEEDSQSVISGDTESFMHGGQD